MPLGSVKREAGARPARSRRCERGVMLQAAAEAGAYATGRTRARKVTGQAVRSGALTWKPDFREGEAGDDAQVRRPACHVRHKATRNWLVWNARKGIDAHSVLRAGTGSKMPAAECPMNDGKAVKGFSV